MCVWERKSEKKNCLLSDEIVFDSKNTTFNEARTSHNEYIFGLEIF